jgi:hypothetical protein
LAGCLIKMLVAYMRRDRRMKPFERAHENHACRHRNEDSPEMTL